MECICWKWFLCSINSDTNCGSTFARLAGSTTNECQMAAMRHGCGGVCISHHIRINTTVRSVNSSINLRSAEIHVINHSSLCSNEHTNELEVRVFESNTVPLCLAMLKAICTCDVFHRIGCVCVVFSLSSSSSFALMQSSVKEMLLCFCSVSACRKKKCSENKASHTVSLTSLPNNKTIF